MIACDCMIQCLAYVPGVRGWSYFFLSWLVFELTSQYTIDGAINPPHFYYRKEEASATLFHYTGLLNYPNCHILNLEAPLSALEQTQAAASLLVSLGALAALGAMEGMFYYFLG
jgi:hypothetical protein